MPPAPDPGSVEWSSEMVGPSRNRPTGWASVGAAPNIHALFVTQPIEPGRGRLLDIVPGQNDQRGGMTQAAQSWCDHIELGLILAGAIDP